MEFIAEHAHEFLRHYTFCPSTGQWRHISGRTRPKYSLHDIRYVAGRMEVPLHVTRQPEYVVESYVRSAAAELERVREDDLPAPVPMTSDFDALRWFPLPHESADPEQAFEGVGESLTFGHPGCG